MAAPMPPVPPVMSATLPSRRKRSSRSWGIVMTVFLVLFVLRDLLVRTRSEVEALRHDHEVADVDGGRTRQHEDDASAISSASIRRALGDGVVELGLSASRSEAPSPPAPAGWRRRGCRAGMTCRLSVWTKAWMANFEARVDRLDRHRDDAGDRTRQEDVAGLARHHHRQDGVHRPEGRVDVEVEHLVPGIGIAVSTSPPT